MELEFHPGALVSVLPSAFAFIPYPYFAPSTGWCSALVISCVEQDLCTGSRRDVEVLLLIDTVLMQARINPALELDVTWKAV